jgi:hypothetical protein
MSHTAPPPPGEVEADVRSRTAPAPAARRRLLAPRWRKLLLTIHIAVAVSALGTDLVLLALGVSGLSTGDADLIRAGYLSMDLLIEAVLLPLALAALLTGVLLGLGTAWGITRHYWVLAKLVLTIGALTAAVVSLRPALHRAATEALAVPLAQLPTTGVSVAAGVTAAPAAALLVLLTVLVLAVFKPWGRIRRGPRRGRATPRHRSSAVNRPA